MKKHFAKLQGILLNRSFWTSESSTQGMTCVPTGSAVRLKTLYQFSRSGTLPGKHCLPVEWLQWKTDSLQGYFSDFQGWQRRIWIYPLFDKKCSKNIQFCQFWGTITYFYPIFGHLTKFEAFLPHFKKYWILEKVGKPTNFRYTDYVGSPGDFPSKLPSPKPSSLKIAKNGVKIGNCAPKLAKLDVLKQFR